MAKRNTELRALASSYKQVADEAEKGTARQVAAARLLEVTNKRLGVSTAEVGAATSRTGARLSSTIDLLSQFGGAAGAQAAVASRSFSQVSTAAGGMGSAVAAGAAVGVLAVGALVTVGVKSYTQLAAEVRNFQRASGASAEDSSRFAAVLDDLNIAAETGAGGVFKLAKRVADGGIELAQYGVAVERTADGNTDLTGTLLNVADAYASTPDQARKAEIAYAAFGKQGQALVPILEQGREGLAKFFESAEGGHQILSQGDLVAAREYELAVDHLSDSMRGFSIQAGRAATPAVSALAEGLADAADWVDKNSQKGKGLERVWTSLGHIMSKGPVQALIEYRDASKESDDASRKAAEQADRTRAAFAAEGVAISEEEIALLSNKDTREEVTRATVEYKQTMEATAESVGLSADAMARHIGMGTQVSIQDFAKATQAAKDFAASVLPGAAATKSAFLKSVDAVGHFSASSIAANVKREAASTKASTKIADNEDRVGDAVQRVADIQESHAEKAAADREAYAEKMVSANEKVVEAEERLADVTLSSIERVADAEERHSETVVAGAERVAEAQERYAEVVTSSGERVAEADQRYTDTIADNKERISDAEERYADIVVSQNERIADADQRLADIRVDSAERVQDAKDRLVEDRASGQEAVRDAQRRLRELQTRDTGGTPEQRAEAARQRDIKRAREDLEKTRRRAAKTDEDNAKALAKAERERIESIAKAQATADEARADAVKTIAKAEDDLAKARDEAIKSDAAAQKAVDQARKDSAKAIAEAEENLGRARTESTKATMEAEKGIADARRESAKATQEAEEGVSKARSEANRLAAEGADIGVQTRAQARELEKAMEAVAEAQEKAGSAGTAAAEEQSVAIAVTTEEMKEFYRRSIEEGQTFSENIRTAIQKGYDPAFISRLMQAGPEEAAPILAQIVSSNDTNLRDMVNAGEQALQQQAIHLADMNMAVGIAATTRNAQTRADFGTAMEALRVLAENGGRMTAEALAEKLGVGVEVVRRIAGDYGGALAAGINPILEGVGGKRIEYYENNPGLEERAAQGAYGPAFAEGGLLPGHGGGDIIDAKLEPGEFVFSVAAVDNLGPENLEELHQRARRGYVNQGAPRAYARGGFVYPDDVPKPPDTSAYGTMVGYAGREVNQKAYNEVVAFVRANPPKRSGGGGGAGGYGYQALIDFLNAAGVENEVTSTVRPGSITSSGNLSLHSAALAADFVSSNMREIFDTFLEITPSLQELFYDPAGFSVKRGQRADFTVGGHDDHVHAATWGSAEEGPGVPGSGSASSGGYSGGGELDQWIADGLRIAAKPGSWHDGIRARAMQESSGDPNAINNWDSNAAAGTPSKGLMQMIDPTFEAHKVPGYDDIWNPVHNVASASNYIESRYGDPYHLPKGGYAQGGLVEALGNLPMLHNGGVVPGPLNEDVLAVLRGGELVVPTDARPRESLGSVGDGAAIDYDRLATAIVRASDSRPITVNAPLHINGREFARATTPEITQEQRRMAMDRR